MTLRSVKRILVLKFLCLPMCFAQQTLATLKDTHRVLLVFAPSDRDPRYVQQMQMLEHHGAEMQERDLVLLPVVTETGPQVTPETLRVIRGPGLSYEEQVLVRQRFHLAPEAFAAILLGKDGGEKLRVTAPVSTDRLNRTIDVMPMRKDEMKERKPQ